MVANPEVLCIHKPTMPYDETRSSKVLAVLREHIKLRGLVQDSATMHLRRPRTCIFSSSKLLGVEMADHVYLVTRAGGITERSKSEITPDMLG